MLLATGCGQLRVEGINLGRLQTAAAVHGGDFSVVNPAGEPGSLAHAHQPAEPGFRQGQPDAPPPHRGASLDVTTVGKTFSSPSTDLFPGANVVISNSTAHLNDAIDYCR